jgi:hypothetical protein
MKTYLFATGVFFTSIQPIVNCIKWSVLYQPHSKALRFRVVVTVNSSIVATQAAEISNSIVGTGFGRTPKVAASVHEAEERLRVRPW